MDAEADILVRPRPVGAQALVPWRPGCAAVVGLEQADALDDRPEVRRIVGVGHDRGDAEMAGRLVRGIVPGLTPGLACERRQQGPPLAAVPALEDARRLGADENAPVRGGERRHLRHLARAGVVVGEALARERPCLAQVAAAPDGRPMPFARRGGIDGAGVLVVDGVVDGPALAERSAQVPVAAVFIALEREEPLSGADQQQRPSHFLLTSGRLHLRRIRSRKVIGRMTTGRGSARAGRGKQPR